LPGLVFDIGGFFQTWVLRTDRFRHGRAGWPGWMAGLTGLVRPPRFI